MEPPEATSIKSMLNIAGILALLIGLVFVLIAVWQIWLYVTWVDVTYWYYVPDWRTGYLIAFIIVIVMAVISFIIFMQTRTISAMVDQRQYQQAKSKTLIWTVLGFIFGGIIVGILFLIAYLKYDDLIRWGQPGQAPPQPYPQQQYPPQQYPPQQPPPRY
jgi:hypothetical protein